MSALRSTPLLAAVAVSAVCVVAPGAAQAGTLDQQQTDASGGSTSVSSSTHVAQSFTAGITGTLDQVDLYLLKIAAPAADLSVEVRDLSGGVPGNAILASAAVPASAVPDSPGAFVSVSLSSPAAVVTGTQYAIVAYTSSFGSNYGWSYGALGGDPYPAGTWFARTPPGSWISADQDLAFRTYVVPAPTASAPPPSGPTTTGQRAAALKKCKKKKSKKARKKCRKRAQALPL